MLENELTYTEIADILGFHSIHHFSSAFKNIQGYPFKVLSILKIEKIFRFYPQIISLYFLSIQNKQ